MYPFSRFRSPACVRSAGAAAARRKRGFNLIESAIVLGVVGLVIGGVWVAAAATKESMKVTDTINGVLFISRNVQRIISNRDAASLPDDTVLDSTLIGVQAFPSNWVSGNTIKHPFGNQITVLNRNDGGPLRFRIDLLQIPKATCITLITRMSGIARAPNRLEDRTDIALAYVAVNWPSPTLDTTSFPVSLSAANAACNVSSNTVSFGFTYTLIN